MATTNVGFVVNTNAALVGATAGAAGAINTLNGTDADQLATAGYVTRLDKALTDLSTAGYAKNGAAALTLTSTTAITLDLTALAAATGVVVAGDTVFATTNKLVFKNYGAVDLTLSPGGSNPANMGFGGTTPTLKIPAGSTVVIESAAGYTVDSTHKTLTITPTAGGSIGVSVGGA